VLLCAAASWVGVVVLAHDMGSMPGTMGLGVGAFVAVWGLMMAAMMLPSVTPFASLYARTLTGNRGLRTFGLVAGYLVAWSAAALPAYGVAWLADRAVGGHPTASTALAVAIFGACGAYQLTPLKDRCLARCRSPLGFVLRFGAHRGRTRDLRAGLYHGASCLGCCWGLMALLIAFGVMNVGAMVVLAAVVVVEKAARWGPRFSKAVGVAALVLAVVVVFAPRLASGLHAPAHGMGRTGGM
jgi:predicted metal-binding membrane protein